MMQEAQPHGTPFLTRVPLHQEATEAIQEEIWEPEEAEVHQQQAEAQADLTEVVEEAALTEEYTVGQELEER